MRDSRVHRVRGLGNGEFLRRYAGAGCVGLFGGASAIDRAIRAGQRRLDEGSIASLWSHVAIFQGIRPDGRHWLIESDLDVGRGQLRNGVQENRIEKYQSARDWPNLAVLDFDLREKQRRQIVAAALELVARGTPYDLGGILETYWAMMRKTLGRGRPGNSAYCSAFVRAVFHHAGIDLAPGVAVHHTLPEHVARTRVAHVRHLLVRDPG